MRGGARRAARGAGRGRFPAVVDSRWPGDPAGPASVGWIVTLRGVHVYISAVATLSIFIERPCDNDNDAATRRRLLLTTTAAVCVALRLRDVLRSTH